MDFKKQTYAIQVSQFIRKMIQEGKLSPGAPVKENDLATFLNISRAPIREALQILPQAGLIVSDPQKGNPFQLSKIKEQQKKWKIKAKKPPISQTLPSLTNFCTICSYPAAPMNN